MKRGRLPLNALRAFEAAVRLGRMRDAADELGVTHGAISRQVRGLEETLGVRLLEGPRNRLVPTVLARELAGRLGRGFDEIEDAVARVAADRRRPLDVSCLGTLSMRWLIPRLVRLERREPDIAVRLTADDGPVDLRRQRIDVAIRVGAGGWPDDALVTPLFADATGPVMAPGLAGDAPPATWRDLAGHTFLHTRTRPHAWRDWCRERGADLDTAGPAFDHFYFMLEAATAGLGVAIAPRVLVADDLRSGRLLAPFGFTDNGWRYVALSRPDPGARTARFLQWLAEESGGEAAR